MSPDRFVQITDRYSSLRIAIVGDFCLDRYLEIDPSRTETSIETGLPVHNIVNVRAQPGAAGTILNNLAALRIGTLHPIGFCGLEGEGSELRAALAARPGVDLAHFIATPERRTFTYCKPLLLESGKPPRELSRLDTKNWTPTPAAVSDLIAHHLRSLAPHLDALIVLDQVDLPETGVITREILAAIGEIRRHYPALFIIGDSRRGVRGWPPVCCKMNRQELAALRGTHTASDPPAAAAQAVSLAQSNGQPVFITLSEQGILGALPDGTTAHLPCLPLRGEIDIVGAGDAVTANLAAAMASGASLREALELANTAASIVIHQLGTTGTATVPQLRQCLPVPAGST